MSQKAERPVLQGQRIKTRKRGELCCFNDSNPQCKLTVLFSCSICFPDEKEKYDPTGFRDAVVLGLENAKDLEQISKFLDTAGNKLDYRRYGEVLFDILIAGGLLVPGGSISQDGENKYTSACIFAASEDMESMREQEQVGLLLYYYIFRGFYQAPN
jgi:hypothetical protein